MAENWARFIEISIHALLAESDRSNVRAPRLGIAFLSTLSLRRATSSCSGSRYSNRYFYPRSPCGERQSKTPALCQAERFLSTLSLRRATLATWKPDYICRNFYPRSPCGERLACHNGRLLGICHFYPRSPCGERPLIIGFLEKVNNFYPRSPCGERHGSICFDSKELNYFYPRSPCGERLIT